MLKNIEIEKISEIIPLINDHGLEASQVAEMTGKSRSTIMRWVEILRSKGYEIKFHKGRGRPRLKI